MNVKIILSFGIGFVSGGVSIGTAAILYFKKKYQKKYEEDIKEMEDYYKRTDEYKKYPNSSTDKKTVDCDDPVRLTSYDRETTKNRIKEPRGQVDYTAYYHTDSAELEHPEDDEEAIEYKEFHRKFDSKPPKIVNDEVFGDLPMFIDHKTMFYYPGNDVLTDENDLIEDNPELLLGDCLTKYGFKDSDEEIIYVLNFEYDTVYEIQKLKGAFYE